MRRVKYALVAALPVLMAVAIRVVYSQCFPLCALYNDNNPEWYLFLCYLCG